MTRRKFLELLDEFYDLNSFKINVGGGIFFWPIARIQAGYFFFLFSDNKVDLRNIKNESALIVNKVRFLDIFNLFKFYFKSLKFKFRLRNSLTGKILLVGFIDHYYKYNDSIESLYISPIKIELQKSNIAHDEFLMSNNSSNKHKSELLDFYNATYEYYRILYKVKNVFFKKNKNYFKNALLFKEFLETKNISNTGHISNIVYRTLIVQEIKYNTFNFFLKTTNPKLIWNYCYYDNTVMALNRAANRLKIENIEYQHSAQSDEHFAYAKWKNVDSYKEVFPNTFWVWKQTDAERIVRNFSGCNYIPKVIVGGNLSVLQHKENFVRLPNFNSGILISLQGAWIPLFVEKVIENDDNYLWYFRLHPRYPEDKLKLLELKEKFPSKVEIEQANNDSLYTLFRKVGICITDTSGVALEASEFGITNIIIGERGSQTYVQEITSGIFSLALNEAQLKESIYETSSINMDFSGSNKMGREKLDSIIKEFF